MNNEDVSFKSQYILERLSSIDEWFTYNITCDSNNKVNDIVRKTSKMRDNFEYFGRFKSIDLMR